MIVNVKRRNARTVSIEVKNSDTTVIDLNTASDIFFVVKKNKNDEDNSGIIKKLSLGEITIDDPSIGFVKIDLDSNDMNLDGIYFVAMQIFYPGNKNQEVDLVDVNTGKEFNQWNFKEDIIKTI